MCIPIFISRPCYLPPPTPSLPFSGPLTFHTQAAHGRVSCARQSPVLLIFLLFFSLFSSSLGAANPCIGSHQCMARCSGVLVAVLLSSHYSNVAPDQKKSHVSGYCLVRGFPVQWLIYTYMCAPQLPTKYYLRLTRNLYA